MNSSYSSLSEHIGPKAEVFLSANKVTDIHRLEKLAGDASGRMFCKVQTKDSSYVLMHLSPGEICSPKDPRWLVVQKLLQKQGLRVPLVNNADNDEGLLLIEDCGKDHLEQHYWKDQFYAQALKMINKFQRVQESPSFFANHKLDQKKCLHEMHLFKTHFLKNYLGLDKGKMMSFDIFFLRLAEFFEFSLSVPCHRDYHSRNIMVKDDELVVIDFQDLMLGNPVYDVVSLVFDPYVCIPLGKKVQYIKTAQNEIDMIRKIPTEEFNHMVFATGAQRLLKALGSYAYLSLYLKRGDYLKYIPQTIQNMSHLRAFADRNVGLYSLYDDILLNLEKALTKK